MTLHGSVRPDVGQVLTGLKDFQRDTVEYIFKRLYTDQDYVSRFLIADEVGLGKTLVARGVIAKAIDHLWETVERIDVVYICSNQAIARQNIDRLNITADRKFQFASRATLLPVTLQQLKGNKLNFVSLTPGTSFNLRSRSGWKYERAVVHALLRSHWDVPPGPLRNVMRGGVRKDRWRSHLEWFEREVEPRLDEELRQAFCDALDKAPELRDQYDAIAEQIGSRRKNIPWEMDSQRNRLIGELRRLLAHSSLAALEPDLVILDEFQRFKYLLADEGDIALLARELFTFPDVKVLLLSATPYKMYTLQEEEGEDHYADFYHTVNFLLGERPEALDLLRSAIERYRRAMFHLGSTGREEAKAAKQDIEEVLRHVMVRTERLAASADRNGMLVESWVAQDTIEAADLSGYIHLDRIAMEVDGGDQVEYWKSAAYPLNLMEGYSLKRKFDAALEKPEASDLNGLLKAAQHTLLSWRAIEKYREIDPSNARLRALWRDTVETGSWRLLWMPPSLHYYEPGGPFADLDPRGCTKTLVFSAWRLVPKTIAMLLSYEVERRMLEEQKRSFDYSELTEKRKPLLTFTRSRGRLTGMPVFCLTYPCLTLAQCLDPLTVSKDLIDGRVPSCEEVFVAARGQVEELLDQATKSVQVAEDGRVDESWYWAALALLDRHFHQQAVGDWLSTEDEKLAWSRMLDVQSGQAEDDSEESAVGTGNRFAEHVQEFAQFFQSPASLGPRPPDLVDVLTLIALCSPAVATLRALLRVVKPEGPVGLDLLAPPARLGMGFRTLFNQPDAISLLQGNYPDGPYWEKALRYCLDGNLQSVMDEYFHVLRESLGLVGHDSAQSAQKICEETLSALSLRAPTLRFDEIVLENDSPPVLQKRGLRCRYALRFGAERAADYEGHMRDVDVRVAFNSPFRPFVLATTSIGQEGLDFHQYCHRIVHWNLPSNPVDLEQREGRIHRYKGHVIRRNLALNYGLSSVRLGEGFDDPWEQVFERARADRPKRSSDLIPYWVFEADASAGKVFKIERKVPMLPLSREIGRLERLKRSLVAYRSVIGQPRQQELLEYLSAHFGDDAEAMKKFVESVTIDLSPPRRRKRKRG